LFRSAGNFDSLLSPAISIGGGGRFFRARRSLTTLPPLHARSARASRDISPCP
jgi:hypothetical protein